MQTPERQEGAGDEQPQDDDLGEGQRTLVPGEENPGPQRVGDQLGDVQPQRDSGAAKAVFPPDQPGGDAHEDVQHRPDRAKHPGGRRPGRLREPAIERGGAGRGDGSDTARDEGSGQPAGKTEGLFF